MTETKRRVLIWLLVSLMFTATVFAFASANPATTHDAHAFAKAGDTE
jgi:hypothetical protein